MDTNRSFKFKFKLLGGCGLIKKCSTTNLFQNNTELFQNSVSEPTALKCHEEYCPKRMPQIGKYSGRSRLLAKL